MLKAQNIGGEYRLKKDYAYYQKIIEDCYIKQNRRFTKVSEEILKNNLSLIDDYTDVVVETFLSHGLQEDYEPNKYGFDLEDTKSYLLQLRYTIVD